jgi:hypothetical protein
VASVRAVQPSRRRAVRRGAPTAHAHRREGALRPHIATRHMQQATRHMQRMTRHMQQATRHMQQATRHMQQATRHIAPHATGEAPHATGDAPHATGDATHASGDAPHATGDAPHDAPQATGDVPHATGDAPHATDGRCGWTSRVQYGSRTASAPSTRAGRRRPFAYARTNRVTDESGYGAPLFAIKGTNNDRTKGTDAPNKSTDKSV